VIACTARIAAIIAVRVADHRGEKADARGAIHGALMRVQYVESKIADRSWLRNRLRWSGRSRKNCALMKYNSDDRGHSLPTRADYESRDTRTGPAECN
jgi:hypothetical protein